MRKKTFAFLILIVGVCVAAWAYSTANYREVTGDRWVIGSGGSLDIDSGGSLDIDSGGSLNIESGGSLDIESGGSLDIESGGEIDVESGGALKINGQINYGFQDVSITSPTTTISVSASVSFINLTTDVSQTGITVTGAVAGDVIVFRGTDDSATCQFDDNTTTLALGGNIVLGADDTLALVCTAVAASGNLRFMRLYSSAN